MADIFDILAPTPKPGQDVFDALYERAPRPDNIDQFVARELTDVWGKFDKAGVERPPAVGLVRPMYDKYRAMAGLPPQQNALDLYREARQKRAEDRSLVGDVAISAVEQYGQLAGGFTMAMAKIADIVGTSKTGNDAARFAQELDNWREGLSPDEGVPGFAGRMVGSTLFALSLGLGTPLKDGVVGQGLVPGSALGTPVTVGQQAWAALGPASAFGVSGAGHSFAEIAQRRKGTNGRPPQIISPAAEWTAAIGAGVAEMAGELFGWSVMRGVAGRMFARAPQLRRIATEEGVQGVRRSLQRFVRDSLKDVLKNAPKGAVEEIATEVMQMGTYKALGINPELGWGDAAKNVALAGLAGGLQVFLTGVPMAGMQAAQSYRARGAWQADLTAMSEPDLAIIRDSLQTQENAPAWAVADVQTELAKRIAVGGEVTSADTAVTGEMAAEATPPALSGEIVAEAPTQEVEAPIAPVAKPAPSKVMYHGTRSEFPVSEFRAGELGFHFGTQEQAEARQPTRIIAAKLNIQNPLRMRDVKFWGSDAIDELLKMGVATPEEHKQLIDAYWGFQTPTPAETLIPSEELYRKTAAVRAFLEAKGFDGIVYANEVEGEGDTYIVFHPSQIEEVPTAPVVEAPVAPTEAPVLAAQTVLPEGKVYHGTRAEYAGADIDIGQQMFGIHTTTDPEVAALYGDVREYQVAPDAKVLDLSDGETLWTFMVDNGILDAEDLENPDLQRYVMDGQLFQYDISSKTNLADDVAKTALDLGYDMLAMIDDLGGRGGNIAYVVVNPQVLRFGEAPAQAEAEPTPTRPTFEQWVEQQGEVDVFDLATDPALEAEYRAQYERVAETLPPVEKAPRTDVPTKREARVGPIPEGYTRDPSQWAADYIPEGAEIGMWHATSNMAGVMREGLRSAADLGVVALGPGAGQGLDITVSTTYSDTHAYQIADRMKLAVLAARSDMASETPLFADELKYGQELRPSDVVQEILSDAGYEDDTPREIANILGATGVEGPVFDDWDAFDAWVDRQFEGHSYELLQTLDDALPEIFDATYADAPVRVGFTATTEQMARIDPDQIGVVQVAAREGAQADLIADESELRFAPEDVFVIAEDPKLDVLAMEVEQAAIEDPVFDGANPVTDGTEKLPSNPIVEGVRDILTNEDGAIPIDQIVSAATGVAATIGEEIGTHTKLLQAIALDEGSVLRTSSPIVGNLAYEMLQEASNRSRAAAAGFEAQWVDELESIPLRRRGSVLRWMSSLRDDGQSNWSTLIEHPDRLAGEAVPEEALRMAAVARATQDNFGDWAVELNAPQVQRIQQDDGTYKWGLGPFRKAAGGRYYHLFTAAGMDMFEYQSGPVYEALLDWHEAHPERNPHIPADRDEAKEVLRQRAKLEGDVFTEGAPARSGSLEFVRVFTELPVVLTVDGKPVEILRRNPLQWFHTSTHQQARALALREVATEQLLARYGDWNEDLQQTVFPLGPPDLGLTDLGGLLESLRLEVVQTALGERQRRANHAFNRALDNYRRVQGGADWFSDYYPVGDTPGILATAGRAIHSGAINSALSLAFLWDVTHWTAASALVGPKAAATGIWSALGDILKNPRKFDAEYRALGVIPSVFTDWTLYRHTLADDVLVRLLRNVMMVPQQFTERRKQFAVARTFDAWLTGLNEQDGIRGDQIELLKRIARLTDDQVLEISRGEMSPQTRAKALQNATSNIVGLTEANLNRSWIQNNPVGRFLLPFMSVTTATARTSKALAEGLANQLRLSRDSSLPANIRKEAAKNVAMLGMTMLAFVAAILGRGWLQKYMRRAATGKPLVEPDDPDTWLEILGTSLAEGGIFGPFYRLFEAGKYSNWDASRYATQLFFPLGVVAEVGSALLGQGRYAGSPWSRRMADLGATRMPAYRAAKNWWDRLMYPMRQDYQTTRQLVRKFEKDKGKEFAYGQAGPRNYNYYRVFEAVRDRDEDALEQSIEAYKAWAVEQGWDAERARLGLRSSLSSRNPVNLAGENRVEFLKGLSKEQRAQVEATDAYYRKMVDRVTRRPGVLPRPPRPPGPPRPPQGGNWYGP